MLILGFWPEVLGMGWRVLHGDHVLYEGWEIPVPKWWLPYQKSEQVIFLAPKGDLRNFNGPDGVITVFRIPTDAASGPNSLPFDRLKMILARLMLTERLDFKSLEAIPVDGTSADCASNAKAKQENEVEIYCVLDDSALIITYRGHLHYVENFHKMLRGIHSASR